MSGSHPHTLLDDLQCRLHDVLGESDTPETVLFTTSFSKEDQILTWAIVEARFDVDMVSLDTGCLFPATQQTWAHPEAQFGQPNRRLVPNPEPPGGLRSGRGMRSIYPSDRERKRVRCARAAWRLPRARIRITDCGAATVRTGRRWDTGAGSGVGAANSIRCWIGRRPQDAALRPGSRSTPCMPRDTRALGVHRAPAGVAG